MKLALNQFTKEEKYLIKELYNEGYSPVEISILTELSFQEVLFILRRMIDDLDLRALVSQVTITDSNVLIVSDTHMGSKLENMDYVRETYRTAKEKGIRTVLHGGDLIQSTFKGVSLKYRDEIKQIEHVIDDYPYDESIMNYILLGNHDFNTFRKDPVFLKMLEERKDFTILGFKRAYLTWLSSLISIYHSTKHYPFVLPSLETDLNLRGHAHCLAQNKTSHIAIPTLSDDLFDNPNARPGFLIGTHSTDSISLESYSFSDSLHYDGKILTKKIK